MICGFQTLFPDAAVVSVDGWVPELYRAQVRQLNPDTFDVLFTINDRATEAVAKYFGDTKAQLAFCNESYADRYQLTAFLYPWDDFVDVALALYRKRSQGDHSIATQHLVTPKLCLRSQWRG